MNLEFHNSVTTVRNVDVNHGMAYNYSANIEERIKSACSRDRGRILTLNGNGQLNSFRSMKNSAKQNDNVPEDARRVLPARLNDVSQFINRLFNDESRQNTRESQPYVICNEVSSRADSATVSEHFNRVRHIGIESSIRCEKP